MTLQDMIGWMRTKGRDFVADKEVRGRGFYNTLKYDAPIDPYKLYHVDPNEISTAMEVFDVPKRKVAGTIRGGSWDKQTRLFIESEGKHHFDVYHSFSRRFKDGVDWEKTNFYQIVMDKVNRGEIWWGCTTERDVKKRCQEVDRMYENIKKNGYKTQAEIHTNDPGVVNDGPTRAEVYRKINGEIAICVGRDGELIFYDGRNRLAISKLLDLDEIPVVILARHKQWQKTRDRVARRDKYLSDLPEQLQNHPDLVDPA